MKNILSEIFSSTTAMIIGVLIFVSSIGGNYGNFITGLIIVIGTLAYQSVSKRKSSNSNGYLRIFLEISGIVSILLVILLQKDLTKVMVENPITNIIIPAILVGSYIYVCIKKS